ncbi:MAG: YbaB/EbfC family nucleoid-associated protein [Candidatus Eisenbacteria bacterium]|nr:YbaB/EbfC family nucleoid-associated protein [Candidatus Eisenbacteria bacterium]MCC7142561.1 YbaB/EbfC family nucleoid-associated protein [Candidatus Eisenbacteria bacterium]
MKELQKIMKQAQQMQSKMAEMQARLAEETVEASAGGGMVTVVVNGKHELVSLKIQPKAVDPEDVELLEDLLLTAINDAQKKAEERIQSELGKITGGMNLPGLF